MGKLLFLVVFERSSLSGVGANLRAKYSLAPWLVLPHSPTFYPFDVSHISAADLSVPAKISFILAIENFTTSVPLLSSRHVRWWQSMEEHYLFIRGSFGRDVARSRTLRIKRTSPHRRIPQWQASPRRARSNRQMGRRGRFHQYHRGRPNHAHSGARA